MSNGPVHSLTALNAESLQIFPYPRQLTGFKYFTKLKVFLFIFSIHNIFPSIISDLAEQFTMAATDKKSGSIKPIPSDRDE